MEIIFSNMGTSLGTRALGKEIRQEIEASFLSGEFLMFNFDGVELISHSFADECFGKLVLNWSLEEIKQKSTFLNANEIVRQVVAFTVNERLLERNSKELVS